MIMLTPKASWSWICAKVDILVELANLQKYEQASLAAGQKLKTYKIAGAVGAATTTHTLFSIHIVVEAHWECGRSVGD